MKPTTSTQSSFPSNVKKTTHTTQPQSTNKIILDYLLYLSIQSRLNQARVELLELESPFPQSKDDPSTIEMRKKRWIETASKAEQDKKAVESIVAGILSSHCNKTPSFSIDSNFEQRLHLCQLTNLVFGRFDALSTGQHVIAHKSARLRRHESHIATVIDIDKEKEETCDIKKRQRIFSRPILPPYCRRHRIQNCYGCRSPYLIDKPDTALSINYLHKLEEDDHEHHKEEEASDSGEATLATRTFKTLDLASISLPTPPAGLIEAIPTFLRTSADMLRRALEADQDEEHKNKPFMFAGQKVMGGGMPPQWYDLFLELLTQAAIESYLCDTQAGLEPIFEIFSYGDVEDEDHEQHSEEEEEEEDEEEEEEEEDEEHVQEEVDEWGIRAADHHLLFPETRTMYLFKTQVREREKDFLLVKGDDLDSHFKKLTLQFPLQTFEKSMGEFIQMILSSMDTPALDNYEQNIAKEAEEGTLETATSTTIRSGPSVYKYPGDGSLLMPEVPDEDDKPLLSEQEDIPSSKKRPASVLKEEGTLVTEEDTSHKRAK